MSEINRNSLVSVIIPTYKRPIFLERAIESVLSQSYNNIEIIIVDDNDPDTEYRRETEILMEKYTSNTRVKYIQHECNKNGSAARNTGFRNSNGSYITFLDDDDEMLENRIKCQVERLESLDDTWGVCYTAYKKLKPNGDVLYSNEKRQGNLYVEALMRSLYIGSGSNFLVKRNVVEEINGYDESFNRNQDIEFLSRVLEKCKIAYIDECTLIVHYEVRENKGSYDKIVGIDEFYLNKFRARIEALPKEQRKRVMSFIALERFRYSIKYRKISEGIKYLIENGVSIINFIRYCGYMLNRALTKKSYGFEI